MSRTQRKEKDIHADNYPTAEWSIERFLEKWVDLPKMGTGKWCEPCVGDGVIIEVVDRIHPGVDWTVCDIRDTSPALNKIGLTDDQITIGDFLEWPIVSGPREKPGSGEPKPFDVIIMNPPFRFTHEFVNHARKLAHYVVCFQSLNFMGSEDRNDWILAHVPDAYVLPDRVSHSGDGKTDAVYSAWYVWGPTSDAEPGLLIPLECTPNEVRRADMARSLFARDETSVALDALFAEVAR